MRSLLAAFLLLPGAANACSVCFGKSEGTAGLASGLWWGIMLLLSVTMLLVGTIGYTLWSVEQRRQARDA